jgi:hypothetical protein
MISILVSILLAGFVVCGDTRDQIDFTAPACPESRQILQCGCGNTAMWEQPAPTANQKAVDHYIVERCQITPTTPCPSETSWVIVAALPSTRRWFHHSEERPLAKTGFLYIYRIWSVAADGTESLTPSNTIKYRAAPITCMDDITFKRVPCWSGS